ncbi:hypothetical protein [Vibrio breoganii]|uniref:hypothetical protein n=1 Tax=Vibrio breoganii TaxID=553239 RepID=UPI000C85CBA3|nr:hypothetical protein [Vibrio breoganii]PML85195.1 hypothetical protein BCT68_07625 [Vibrio breoganii]
MSYTNQNSETINAKLKELNQVQESIAPAHFSWYQYYTAIAPDPTLQPPVDSITLRCSRHNTIFATKYRYIINIKSKPTLCPECHYEFDKDKLGKRFNTKYKDLAEVFERQPALGFVLILGSENNNNVFLKNTDRVTVLCRQCHSPTEHRVNNLKTHIKNGHHLFCQHCSCKKKGKSRRISFEDAQKRVEKFTIDTSSYQGFAATCLLTCSECSQRHMWTPQAASRGQCARCGNNGAMPITLMPSLNNFNELLMATSSWQLSTEPAHIRHNEDIFAQRLQLPKEARIHLQCQIHPETKSRRLLRSMHAKIRTQKCRLCEAQRKSKYTAQYLNSLFATESIPIRIDMKASDLKQENHTIPSQYPIRIRCMKHGALSKSYTSYALFRYIRENQIKNPCPDCQPSAGLGLSAQRVREVVESTTTWDSHGALYKLHETDQEINTKIESLKEHGKVPYDDLVIVVEIQQTLDHALGLSLPTPPIVKMAYKAFLKGKKGYISLNQSVSWLVKYT